MRHKCLAVFLVFILYFSIITTVSLIEFKTLSKPKNIVKVLLTSRAYENIPKLLEATLFKTENKDQSIVFFESLVKSVDPKMLQTETEKNITPFLDYLNGRTSQTNVSFDLKSLKKNLSQNLDASYQDIVHSMPDIFNLNEVKDIDKTLSRARLGIKINNILFYISLILSLILIGCLALLGKSYWPAILRWIGISLFLPGTSLLLFTLLFSTLPAILIKNFASNVDPAILTALNPIIVALINSSRAIGLIYGGIISSVGFILILLSYILPHPPDPSRPARAEAGPKPPVKQSPQSPPAPTLTPTK